MNTKTFIATAAALLGYFATVTNALAANVEAWDNRPMATTSTVSRAEVRDAFLQARAAGFAAPAEVGVETLPVGAGKTRAQVVAETREAARIGAIQNAEQTVPVTVEQLQRIDMAGLRALVMTVASL
jgi:hypothetical protein